MFSFGDRSAKVPVDMHENAVQDEPLDDFLHCNPVQVDLFTDSFLIEESHPHGKTDLVYHQVRSQSPELGSMPIPTTCLELSGPQMHNDDLSIDPSDIDSEILDQTPELSDDDDVASPPTPCHTTESFTALGALMALKPALERFENEHCVETPPNNDDAPVKPAIQVLAILFQYIRLSLPAIFMSIQGALHALISLCLLAKTALLSLWWTAKAALLLLFAAEVLLVNVVKTPLLAIASPQLMLVIVVGMLGMMVGMMGCVNLGLRYDDLSARSNVSILESDHNDMVISAPFIEEVQNDPSSFVESTLATFQSLLPATEDEIIEPAVILEQLKTIHSYGTPVEQAFNILCSIAAVVLSCLALNAYVHSFSNVPDESQPKTKRAGGPKKTLRSVDFTTPVKMSNYAPEVVNQLHVLGMNKSGDDRANIQQLVKVRKELFDNMKRDDLRIILKEHGMSPSGLKKDLSKRLAEQWSIVPLPLSKPDIAKSLIDTRRQLFGECKTQDLQRLLKEHGMSPSGNKVALAQRLAESYRTIGLPATR